MEATLLHRPATTAGRSTTLLAVTVTSVEPLGPDTRRYTLEPEDGSPLPAFEAGAHIDLHLPGALVRQYSLCNPPGEHHRYQIAVKREPASRGGSRSVHDTLVPGTRLTVSAPRNHFPLVRGAAHSLLFAGGIGITPLLSMAHQLRQDGSGFALHHFVRDNAHASFGDTLHTAFAGQGRQHLGLAPEAVTRLAAEAAAQAPAGTQAYLCGPAGFMEALRATLAPLLGASAVHMEYFGAAPAPAGTGRFEVRLARSGRCFDIGENETIADVLHAAGVDVPTSCEQGVCGTCVTGVLGGEPEHHDLFLTDDEKASGRLIALCVSRCRGTRLELDL